MPHQPAIRCAVFAVLGSWLTLGISGCDSVRTARATAGAGTAEGHASREPAPLPEVISFNEHIQPILSEYCYHCHGPDSGTRLPKDEPLRLDQAEAVFAGRESGRPVIVKGRPADSLLVALIKETDPHAIMPPPESHKVMKPEEIARIERWIEQGAEYEPHWAFAPIQRPAIPEEGAAWSSHPIDRFIFQELAKAGLQPSPPEEPRRFHRRLCFDLTGLPPRPEETNAFVEAYQRNPQAAVEAEADRLLATTASAEHFARHWLDAARYADTHGIHIDNYRTIWPYRDWVVRAFQANMPWDRFTLEQLAGDLLPDPTLDQLVATGFNRCLPTTGEGGAIPEEYEAIYAQDRVDTTAAVWLGLTAGCAACHDHKFDPLPTREFYSLTAFFRNNTMAAMDRNQADHPPAVFVPLPGEQQRWAELTAAIAAAGESSSPGLEALKAEQEALRQRGSMSLIMEEKKDQPAVAHVLARGVYSEKGEQVGADTPAALPPMPAAAPKNRLGLARWLVDPSNPLPARVTMNRTWYLLFGTGIVETTEDFGIMGARPSHPKLLDWLASRFLDAGWNYREMVKTMVTSSTYRQSGQVSAAQLEADPANRLLGRGPRHRLDAEQLRDLALAASGLLSPTVGGPPVKPYQPEGVWEAVAMKESNTRVYRQDHGESLYRRSLYTFWKRTAAPPSMEILNAPTREVFCVRRDRTNTPLQALVLLNDPQFVEASRALAGRALLASENVEERLDFITSQLLARRLQPQERAIVKSTLARALQSYRQQPDEARAFVTTGESKIPEELDLPELAAWTLIASQLLNLDETVTH